MNSPRSLVFLFALALTACGGDQADKAESAAKEHFMSAQQKVLEQAKEVTEMANEKLEEQKEKLEEVTSK
jgi:hypothetical protein